MLEILYRIYRVLSEEERSKKISDENSYSFYNSYSNINNEEVCMDCFLCESREDFKEHIKAIYGADTKFANSKKYPPNTIYCVIIGEHCYNAEKYFKKKIIIKNKGVKMEEEQKERYEIYAGIIIHDTDKNAKAQLLSSYQCCVVLNEQDQKIKKLQEENKDLKHWMNMFHKLAQEEDTAICRINKSLDKPMVLITDYNEWGTYALEKLKQSQNKKAIEELERVQVQCQFDITFADYEQEQRLYDYINNRIKELKGE